MPFAVPRNLSSAKPHGGCFWITGCERHSARHNRLPSRRDPTEWDDPTMPTIEAQRRVDPKLGFRAVTLAMRFGKVPGVEPQEVAGAASFTREVAGARRIVFDPSTAGHRGIESKSQQ